MYPNRWSHQMNGPIRTVSYVQTFSSMILLSSHTSWAKTSPPGPPPLLQEECWTGCWRAYSSLSSSKVVYYSAAFFNLPPRCFGPHEIFYSNLDKSFSIFFQLSDSFDSIQFNWSYIQFSTVNQKKEKSVLQPPNLLLPKIVLHSAFGSQKSFQKNVSESGDGRWQSRRGGKNGFFKKVRPSSFLLLNSSFEMLPRAKL